jgi:hypothetical protein
MLLTFNKYKDSSVRCGLTLPIACSILKKFRNFCNVSGFWIHSVEWRVGPFLDLTRFCTGYIMQMDLFVRASPRDGPAGLPSQGPSHGHC